MHYELNLTTSRLRRTPPKNYLVIFKRRVIALFDSIAPPIFFEKQEVSFGGYRLINRVVEPAA